MSKVFPGRYTAHPTRDFVVFIIGMRFNRWWLPHKYIPILFAMPRMLKKLEQDKSLGMRSYENFFRLFPLTTSMVTYWDSFEKLEAFAIDKELPHAKAWADYMKSVGQSGAVGIYHETYKVKAGEFECLYGNMPKFGLAAAFEHLSVNSVAETARARISSMGK